MREDLPTLFPAQAARLRGRVAADGTVVADLACRRCTYNLRGLHLTGHCPECGTTVDASFRGDDFLYADPCWLRRLARGAELLPVGWFMVIAALVSAIASTSVARVVALASVPLMAAGTWLLTRPDPANTGEAWYGWWRRAACVVGLVGCGAPIVAILDEAVSHPSLLAAPHLKWLLGSVPIAALVGMLLLLNYLKAMVARRMPDREMEERMAFAMWLAGGGAVLLTVIAGIVNGILPAGAAEAAACWLAVPLLLVGAGGFAAIAAVWNVGAALRLQAARADEANRGLPNGGADTGN